MTIAILVVVTAITALILFSWSRCGKGSSAGYAGIAAELLCIPLALLLVIMLAIKAYV